MPNGGPDCCGNCSYNKAVQEMGHPHPGPRLPPSHCTLRDVKITKPFWTYCGNFSYGENPETRNREETPRGWITASGLYEGYVRIPWDDKSEPHVSVPTSCLICGRKSAAGIEIDHNDTTFGFCTNRHYVEWWVSVHHDKSFLPEDFELPEQIYKVMEIDPANRGAGEELGKTFVETGKAALGRLWKRIIGG